MMQQPALRVRIDVLCYDRACMHDPHTWDQPDEFRPERFIRDDKLDHDVMDPSNIVFGSGRRSACERFTGTVKCH